jgi:hypothetical protein
MQRQHLASRLTPRSRHMRLYDYTPYARSRMLLTDFACHWPPRAVATPRVFSAAAISLRDVAPAFCASRMIERTLAAIGVEALVIQPQDRALGNRAAAGEDGGTLSRFFLRRSSGASFRWVWPRVSNAIWRGYRGRQPHCNLEGTSIGAFELIPSSLINPPKREFTLGASDAPIDWSSSG